MNDKSLKFRNNRASTYRTIEWLQEHLGNDECKVQFVYWADSTYLDISGIFDGEPIFRPAICAWEAWKAAWVAAQSKP